MILCSFLLLSLATAFDVGHHADLVRNAMLLRRYAPAAADVAVAHAWLADYFAVYEPRPSNASTAAAALAWLAAPPPAAPSEVDAQFANLAAASETLVREYAAANRSTDLVALLGVTLHAVQRFYSASNWAALHARKACTCFGTSSWFDASPPAQLAKVTVAAAAALGAYCNGSNVESYASAGWEDAYGAALVASVRWIDMVEAWAGNASDSVYPLLGRASPLRPDEPLFATVQAELLYMHRLASWSDAPPPYTLGRWKGPQSAAALKSELVAKELADARAKLTFRQRFADADADWRDVAAAVQSKSKPSRAATPTPLAPLADLFAVLVRTNSVKALGGGRDRDKNDFYANVEFEPNTGHALFTREAVQRDTSDLSPPWSAVYFADATVVSARTVRVTYSLLDEDGFKYTDDAPVLIRDLNDTIAFSVNLDTGAVTGDGFTAGADGVIAVKGMPSPTAAAADLKLTVRVARVEASCTGTAAPACHTPGTQVCEQRTPTSRVLLSGSAQLSSRSSVAAFAMLGFLLLSKII